jgi:hypothetical protein
MTRLRWTAMVKAVRGCAAGCLTCGGLLIRLPPLDAPLRSPENRLHRLRLAAMRSSHSATKRVRTFSKLSVPKWRSLASFKYRSVCQSRSQ